MGVACCKFHLVSKIFVRQFKHKLILGLLFLRVISAFYYLIINQTLSINPSLTW